MLSSTRSQLRISTKVVEKLMSLARKHYPHEALALLRGWIGFRGREPVVLVHDAVEPRSYISTPSYTLFDASDIDGLRIVGFWHSHPLTIDSIKDRIEIEYMLLRAAIPSIKDIDAARDIARKLRLRALLLGITSIAIVQDSAYHKNLFLVLTDDGEIHLV